MPLDDAVPSTTSQLKSRDEDLLHCQDSDQRKTSQLEKWAALSAQLRPINDKPYVYWDISKIIRSGVKIDFLKVVGVFRCLPRPHLENCQHKQMKLNLHFPHHMMYPRDGTNVEIYGGTQHNQPHCVDVDFFSNLGMGDICKYVKVLEKITDVHQSRELTRQLSK